MLLRWLSSQTSFLSKVLKNNNKTDTTNILQKFKQDFSRIMLSHFPNYKALTFEVCPGQSICKLWLRQTEVRKTLL